MNILKKTWNYLFSTKRKELDFFDDYDDESKVFIVTNLTKEQYELVENEIEKFYKFIDVEWKKGHDEITEKNRLFNEICPKCESTNVNDRIREKDVNLSASASSYGGYYASAETKFAKTSVAVSKCNSCQHEWFKKDDKYHPPFEHYIHAIERLCKFIRKGTFKNINLTEDGYYGTSLKVLIPFISVESFIYFRNKFDTLHYDYEGRIEDITHERLKLLGFKTLEENHNGNRLDLSGSNK